MLSSSPSSWLSGLQLVEVTLGQLLLLLLLLILLLMFMFLLLLILLLLLDIGSCNVLSCGSTTIGLRLFSSSVVGGRCGGNRSGDGARPKPEEVTGALGSGGRR